MGRWSRAAGLLIAVGLLSNAAPTVAATTDTKAATRYPSVPFVVACSVSHVAKDDPIVHPGMSMGSHTHVFFGNRSTSAKSTFAGMAGAATSCLDPLDRAAYWLPQLKGGASWSDMRAYYSAGSAKPEAVQPYPTGMQLIAGSSPIGKGAPQSVRWSCSLGVSQEGWTVTPPGCSGGRLLSVRVTFPQCWSGLSVTDPKQVKYAVGGTCPLGYPKVLPELSIVARVQGTFADLEIGNADRMHADFWNFWVPSRLDELVSTCIRGERTNNADLKKCNVEGAGPARL